ncbi:MAG: hypothetical protein Q7S21_04445 [archaeon]|nr:hypothetical protein [archaeon]
MSFSKSFFSGLVAGIVIAIVYALVFQFATMFFPEFFPIFDSKVFVQGDFPLHFFVPIIWGIIFGFIYSKINLIFHGSNNSVAIQFALIMWFATIIPMLLFFLFLIQIGQMILLFWGITFLIAFILASLALVRVFAKLP